MKLKTTLVLLAVTLILAMTACSGGDQTKEALMQSPGWVLVEFQGTTPIGEPTLRFQDGQASGTTGCNNWIGTYQVNRTNMRIREIEKTEEFCENPPGIMEQESTFVRLLEDSERFELEGERLTIFTSSGESLIFNRMGN